jgi:hypothetical protein
MKKPSRAKPGRAEPSRSHERTGLLTSPQNELAKQIFEYWQQVFPDRTSHTVLCDQGKKWGEAKGSAARTGISLFTESGIKGRATWMARPDVAVVDIKGNRGFPPFPERLQRDREYGRTGLDRHNA